MLGSACLKAQRDALLAPGLLIQWLPRRGHRRREVFYLCQKKGGDGRSIVLGLQNHVPSLKLWGQWGVAFVAFFFHGSGGGLG